MWPKANRTKHIAGPVCVCIYQQQSVYDAQQALHSSRGPAELWGSVCLLRPWTPRRHPPPHHTHTPANTYAQTTPCPLNPTPPPFLLGKPSLYTWSLCRGCMRAALWITSGPAARVCHLARQHDPSCQSCFIIVTFSYSLAKWREGPGQETRTQTHTHTLIHSQRSLYFFRCWQVSVSVALICFFVDSAIIFNDYYHHCFVLHWLAHYRGQEQ